MLIFIRDRLLQLGKRLPFRQQCVATAMTYLQRYFLFTPIQNVNIYLLVATAFYLASKTEESPHHIRLVASEARQAWPEYIPNDVSRLGEMEFCLISEMHSQLIVWHPYRSLMALKDNQNLSITNEELVLAWSIVNDTYMTDLPLTCVPHLLAVTALFLAVVFNPGKSIITAQSNTPDLKTLGDRPSFTGLGGRQGIVAKFGNVAENLGSGQSNTTMSNNNINTNNTNPSTRPSLTTNTNINTEDPSTPNQPKPKSLTIAPRTQTLIKFVIESELDIERMIEATQEIISLYEIWEKQYNEKNIKEAVARCLKGRGLDG